MRYKLDENFGRRTQELFRVQRHPISGYCHLAAGKIERKTLTAIRKLNQEYKKAADEFARRVTSAFGDQVDSIVLYGSVARSEAAKDSDIDVLVVSTHTELIRAGVSEIENDFAYECDYTFYISLFDITRVEFYRLRKLGSPFIEEVVREGIRLYDNGIFSRLREAAAKVG